jgi:RND superfamily putative drug exporter
MPSFLSTAGLARISARRPWVVLGAWVLVLVVAVGLMSRLSDALTTEANFTNEPEAVKGLEALEASGLQSEEIVLTETVVIQSETYTVDSPEFQQVVTETTATLRGMTEIVDPESVVNYYELTAAGAPQAAGLVSEDRTSTIIPVTFLGDLDDASSHATEYLEAVEAQRQEGFTVVSVGTVSIGEEFNVIAEEDLAQGEGIGGVIALFILIGVFGALLAAVLPIGLAVASIMVALGLTAALGFVFDFSFFITNMITMIGLAVGIDYALFIVERYREERRHGRTKHEAIEVAGGTATRAVFFSGVTVIFALLGLILVPSTIFRSLGTGAILVVVVAIAATLTLIPALLSLLGDKINWPRKVKYDAAVVAAQDRYDHETIHAGFWGRVTKVVMARPLVAVVIGVAFLLAAAAPLVNINTGFAGVETLPESDARTGFEILEDKFSAGRLAPVKIVVDGPKDTYEVGATQLVADLRASGTYTDVADPVWSADGGTALITATLGMGTNDPAAFDEVDRLRESAIPATFGSLEERVYVTGDTAFNADFFQLAEDWTPLVFVFVLGLSFLLLMLVFRSIVLPLKAIILNLLSVGAAYGLLVLVFQEGVGADLLGFQQVPMVEAWIPIFLFCILFGLSMDYHVFLLSRIKEHFDQTGRNAESVAVGLQSTAKIITGAALIMVAVFSGFAMGRLVMLQQMGFGLAVAVFVDATLIRSVLVPASMALLGKWNWYLPTWLGWLPKLNVEGHVHRPAPSHGPAMTEGAAD